MKRLAFFLALLAAFGSAHTPPTYSHTADTLSAPPNIYDPFGPENSPDHMGQGSGGVITPSPYENLTQAYYTRISSDYYGVQYMLRSSWQVSTGTGWSSYVDDIFGILFKVRTSGFERFEYDLVTEQNVPIYSWSFEGSFEYALNERNLRAFKVRVNVLTTPKSLGMAGVGLLLSDGNLTVARDRLMNREWDAELTWKHISGGYVMPLSPNIGGVNIAICAAIDLLGVKYQRFLSNRSQFYGTKVGSIGWLLGAGWNALSFVNLGLYVGGEWGFCSGGLVLPTKKIVRADIARNTLYLGVQATGQFFNVVGGIQKEWEYLDFQKTVASEKMIRYYLGANYYFRR
ncbi:MAG TPA: hypothetical protein VNL69_10945 [Bacteroidota bacterium]|nr:hypothetical protein [Bacteroidota bacterium]